jgi:ribose transport system permease protein
MIKSIIRRREFGILLTLFLMVVVFSLINPAFLRIDNIQTILRGGSFIGVMSVGVAWVLISGTFDLSTGAVAGMTAVITSVLIVRNEFPIIPSLIIGLMAGGAVGIVNYNLVFKAKIPAFLATIGTMFIAKGLALYISKGWDIYPLPDSVGEFGRAHPLGISWHFIIFISLVIISEIVLFLTVYGLEVRATGSDREIAIMTEVNVRQVNISTYVIAGVLSALSGILLMTRIITGKATIGDGWELQVITGVAIGGVSLFGYEGSFLGVFLGVITLQVLQNGLIVIGLSQYLNTIVVGMVLLVTATIDWQRRTQLDL